MQGVHHQLEPLTWTTAFTTWTFATWWNVATLLAALAYGLGLARLRRRRHARWPLRRTAAFATGLVAWAVAMNSSVAVYSHALFTMHMVQHLMLIMVVPALLICGKPLQLVVDLDGTGRAERVLRGRTVGYLTHPALTLVLYAVVLVATHLTPFMQVMLTVPGLHDAESALYLVTGYLTFLPMIGFEPIRWGRLAYPLRLFAAMMAMAPDTGIGVILMTADDPLFPAYGMRDWGFSALTDQRVGGAIMWFFGDGIMALFAIVLVGMWRRAPSSQAGFGTWLESARRHALAGTSSHGETSAGTDAAAMESTDDVDEDERARRAYNAMLARLAGREPPREDDADPGDRNTP